MLACAHSLQHWCTLSSLHFTIGVLVAPCTARFRSSPEPAHLIQILACQQALLEPDNDPDNTDIDHSWWCHPNLEKKRLFYIWGYFAAAPDLYGTVTPKPEHQLNCDFCVRLHRHFSLFLWTFFMMWRSFMMIMRLCEYKNEAWGDLNGIADHGVRSRRFSAEWIIQTRSIFWACWEHTSRPRTWTDCSYEKSFVAAEEMPSQAQTTQTASGLWISSLP